MLKASLYGSIAELEPTRWDGVPGDPFSTHAVLAAIEAAELPGVRLRYATLEDSRGVWRAVAPLARVGIDGARLVRGRSHRAIERLRRLRPGFMQTSVMVVGTPLSVGNPPARIALDTDVGPIWRALAGILQEVADDEGAPWRAFKELSGRDATRAGGELGGHGWTLAPSEPGFILPLAWRSYDEYLGSLRSAYRYKVRKAARALGSRGIELDVVALGEAYDAGLHALYEAVVARAPTVFERLTPTFFTAFGRAQGAAAPLLRFRRDGRVVGWVAMLLHGETAYDLFHGIDYDENGRAAIYANQLTAVIRLALERGARRLSLGQSTPEAKLRAGAIPQPLWLAFRHRSGPVSSVVRATRGALFPARELPARHVFAAPAAKLRDGAA